MAATTDHVLAFLKDKTPVEIEKTLSNLRIMAESEAHEAGAIAARRRAADEKMSLAEVQVKLEKAVGANDLEALQRWQPLHLAKLRWVQNQVDTNEAVRTAKANAPAVEARQGRRSEILQELDTLTRGTVSGNFDRIGALQDELRGLA